MKKALLLVLALMLVISLLTACGSVKDSVQDAVKDALSGNSQDGKADANEIAKDLAQDAIEHNSFSLAAAETFWNKVAGVEVNDVAPDWDWIVKEERMATYGDKIDTAYGHASVLFEKKDGGEVTEDEFRAWAKQVFDATAAASDDGHNIIGWEFVGDGEDAYAEVSFDRAFEGWLQGWGFIKNGRNMVVYLGEAYDNNKDSTTERSLFYYGVSADIAFGMEKSMDDLMGDLEEAFDEHGDEIKSELEKYGN